MLTTKRRAMIRAVESASQSQSSSRIHHDGGTSSVLHALQFALAAYILYLTQVYIGATFTGTRASRLPGSTALRPAANAGVRGAEPWASCAGRLARTLQDAGAAGSLWQRSAYVGTPGADEAGGARADARYACRCQVPAVYAEGSPRLSAVVQSYNHVANIGNISTALSRSRLVDEVVICEDGSSDGSLSAWAGALREPGHFVVRSNNLHELRSYNRAMRLAAGSVVVLLQDDDLLPADDGWIERALALFDAYPDLGVLGGYVGQLWDPRSGTGYEYGEQVSTHGGVRQGNTERIPYVQPTTGLPFMFVECAWIAPLFVRRTLLRKAGGLELAIAKRGEPGVWQDCVFGYQAWVNGFSVAVFDAPFERGVGGHGSAATSEKVEQRKRVWERAVAYTNQKFSRKRIHKLVEERNKKLLKERVFEEDDDGVGAQAR